MPDRYLPIAAADKPGYWRIHDLANDRTLDGLFQPQNAAAVKAAQMSDDNDRNMEAIARHLRQLAACLLLLCCLLPATWCHAATGTPADLAGTPASATAEQDGISIYFSPNGGCTEAIVTEIAAAKKSIDVQAYSLTAQPIGDALAVAKKRGVKIRVLLDHLQSLGAGSLAGWCVAQGFEVRIDGHHKIAHNKLILIDGKTAIGGSFNYTANAEKFNAENVVILHDKPKLLAAYEANFAEHWSHSAPPLCAK